jgi:hypothetical protein
VVEGTIEQLFEGHHINYIECINVEYKSNRKESFYGMGCLLHCLLTKQCLGSPSSSNLGCCTK